MGLFITESKSLSRRNNDILEKNNDIVQKERLRVPLEYVVLGSKGSKSVESK